MCALLRKRRCRELTRSASKASLIADAEHIKSLALAQGNLAAAIAALKELGILSGKRVERQEKGSPGEFEWLENMSAEELRAMIQRAMMEAPSTDTEQ
jgi:hypothetical protein